jgi:hypothetical protein
MHAKGAVSISESPTRECLRFAQIISNPTEKSVLLQMAETWRRLASEIESRNTSSDDEKEKRGGKS